MEKGFYYTKEKIKTITTEPGCYLMKDHEDKIFYVGKAKNLRSRLRSYFFGNDTRLFVQYLEHILYDVDILVVQNDTEALILERELIKKHKPRFNIMLRDDKNYILLKLKKPADTGKMKDKFPKIEIVRKAKKDNARYFGPYPSAQQLRVTLNIINKYFLLRTCPDQILANRIRPCIQYQIGRCMAPCVYDSPDYKQEVYDVMLFLTGNYKEIEKRLHTKMWALSQNEQFEAAAKVRDQLRAIKTSLTKQIVSEVNQQRNQDIIGFHRLGPEVEIVRMLVRNGNLNKNENYSFSNQPFMSDEILRSFVDQIYLNLKEELPHDILIGHDINEELAPLKELLQKKHDRKININTPKRGRLLRLVNLANKNAETALKERLKQKNADEKALLALKDILDLALKPKRIECVDISLIQGSDAYGSLVTFIDGRPDKTKYRTYKIKTVEGMNDYLMINEVISRRIKQGIKDNNLPDLMLIDGGKGQLNAAIKAVKNNNLLITKDGFYIAGIAKARALKETKKINNKVIHSSERLFVPHKQESIVLKPHTFERYLVERIRDEAHRFAVKAHTRGRKKRTLESQLLSIKGIGKKRALALLKHFGSVKKIKEASPKSIAHTIKIKESKAQDLINELNAKERDA